jgi:XTP/dITP diphosphohydrolase
VRSARYAGVHGDDEANNARLLRELGNAENRSARYVCVLVLARPDGEVVVAARGVCEGEIAREPRGHSGFGYDPLFIPERTPTQTMAQLTRDQKSLISHRAQGLHAFLPLLRTHLFDAEEPKGEAPEV